MNTVEPIRGGFTTKFFDAKQDLDCGSTMSGKFQNRHAILGDTPCSNLEDGDVNKPTVFMETTADPDMPEINMREMLPFSCSSSTVYNMGGMAMLCKESGTHEILPLIWYNNNA